MLAKINKQIIKDFFFRIKSQEENIKIQKHNFYNGYK